MLKQQKAPQNQAQNKGSRAQKRRQVGQSEGKNLKNEATLVSGSPQIESKDDEMPLIYGQKDRAGREDGSEGIEMIDVGEVANQGSQKQELEDPESTFTTIFKQLRKLSPIMQMIIMSLIFVLAFLVRVFSVIKYESVIHEFDPWFNYRSTKFMDQNGVYAFWNWYDSESWHPLGRVVGGTVYPGIMFTACFMKWFTAFIGFPMEIRNVCVFMAPFFSGFQSLSVYNLLKQTTNRAVDGLFAALFMAIVPAIISRGCAGSYDNEAVAIWAMVNTFYLWIKSCNTGSIMWTIVCTLNYFYMVASWGGYSFIINIIPLFVVCCMFVNKLNNKIVVAYSVFYTLGTLMSALITFVNFQVLRSSEHLLSHLTFILMIAFVAFQKVREQLPSDKLNSIIRFFWVAIGVLFALLFAVLTLGGRTRFSGRSMTLIDPSYAANHMPLVASVAEHAATAWGIYLVQIHNLLFFVPLGFYLILTYKNHKATYGSLFLALYLLCSIYFSCVMIRLVLIVAPAIVLVAAVAVGWIVRKAAKAIRLTLTGESQRMKGRHLPVEVAIVVIVVTLWMLWNYILHSNLYSAEVLSSPSIVLSSGNQVDGTRHIIDDFREAYYWLKQNTKQRDKILSWWDYGYQITGMSNRTVIVDNNTWNNTHIATVGKFLQSNEQDGYEIAQKLDANYVLVIFGGLISYSGDDLAKFLWFVRIAAGVYPEINEQEFYKDGQHFGVADYQLSDKLKESLTYKFLYYRFGEMYTYEDEPLGFDAERGAEIGYKDFDLKYFEEAYTSRNWLVRIYRVLPQTNRGPQFVEEFPRRLMEPQDPTFPKDNPLEFRGSEEEGQGFEPLI